jgi:small subunit ribosomal protein S7
VSRRSRAVKRPVPPDPRYDSQTVSKFINNLMERGKKGLAERVFYSAMDMIEQRTNQPGVTVFKQAVSNAKPAVEVKSRASVARRCRCRSKYGPSGARRWPCAG